MKQQKTLLMAFFQANWDRISKIYSFAEMNFEEVIHYKQFK